MDTCTQRCRIAALVALCMWLAACSASPIPPTTAVVTVRPPAVEVFEAPSVVCRAATQVRLQLQTSQDLASDPAGEWLLRASQGQVVQQGTWPVRDGAVLISFLQGRPLPPGRYTVVLSWQGTDLAEHDFLVDSQAPTIANLTLSLIPDGATYSRLPSNLHGFYVDYQLKGGCLGAPYWATVWDAAGEILCNQSGVLAGTQEQGAFACYRADGEVLIPGDYRVEMTLMEEAAKGVDFVVEAAPVSPLPIATPVALPVVCDDLFVAAGLTAAGEPFLPLALFDWYTQAVYAGAYCRNLHSGVGWHTSWYHEGDLVQEGRGDWESAAEGLIWDSLTGVPGNPFLAPGAYTVTLTIEGTVMSTAFSVFNYEPITTTDGDLATE